MTSRRFSIGRGAVVTACSILEGVRTNAEVEDILLEYGLSDRVSSEGSISKTLLGLKYFVASNPDCIVKTDFGDRPLAIVLVEETIRRVRWTRHTAPLWDKLERYLNAGGYALEKEESNSWEDAVKIRDLTVSLPQFAELPEAASEVDILLDRFSFAIAQQHLSSAKTNIAQAEWEAANSQSRSFLEALTDAIADTLYPAEAASRKGGLQKRQLLAEKCFLSREKHEFGDGNSQTFLPGLAKLLHSDGSHPGISTQHDAMFRLQIVLVTARWLLKRLENEVSQGAQR